MIAVDLGQLEAVANYRVVFRAAVLDSEAELSSSCSSSLLLLGDSLRRTFYNEIRARLYTFTTERHFGILAF